MSYRTSLGKYIDSTALMAQPALRWTIELLRPGLFKMYLPLRITAHLAVHCCTLSWNSQLRKEEKSVFEKTTITFQNLFVREKGKLYVNTNGAFHHTL